MESLGAPVQLVHLDSLSLGIERDYTSISQASLLSLLGFVSSSASSYLKCQAFSALRLAQGIKVGVRRSEYVCKELHTLLDTSSIARNGKCVPIRGLNINSQMISRMQVSLTFSSVRLQKSSQLNGKAQRSITPSSQGSSICSHCSRSQGGVAEPDSSLAVNLLGQEQGRICSLLGHVGHKAGDGYL